MPLSAPAKPRRRSAHLLTGAPLQRVWHIHARLVREEPITSQSLARELEVNPATIKRDLDFMRDRLGMPIEWDAVAHTYVYTRTCAYLPLLCLNEREALTLAVVGRVLAGGGESPLGRDLDAIVRKIAPVFGGAVAVAVDSVDRVLDLAEVAPRREFEHFFPILQALLDRRQVRIDYAKPGQAGGERRLVHPLHLTRRQERWRLIAYDTGRRDIRQFVLERIRSVTPLDARFEPPQDFAPRRHLGGSMGAFAGGPEREVRLALDAEAAAYARERPWHASQTLRRLADGRMEITLRLNNLTDVKHTVLRWGSRAEVLAPADLRAEVAAELQAAAGKYRA